MCKGVKYTVFSRPVVMVVPVKVLVCVGRSPVKLLA